MKKILVLVTSIIVSNASTGQVLAEWFQQKQTQKRYLLQQIAALQVYLNYAKKGYNIAEKGINTIRDIKNGDFNVHRQFMAALHQINPKVAKYNRVVDIVACQVQIINKAKSTLRDIESDKQCSTDELDYCKKVFNDLLAECNKNIGELILVISPGAVEMSDDERLQRINKIYTEMIEKYTYCFSISDEMKLLFAQRINEATEINRLKLLGSIK